MKENLLCGFETHLPYDFCLMGISSDTFPLTRSGFCLILGVDNMEQTGAGFLYGSIFHSECCNDRKCEQVHGLPLSPFLHTVGSYQTPDLLLHWDNLCTAKATRVDTS